MNPEAEKLQKNYIRCIAFKLALEKRICDAFVNGRGIIFFESSMPILTMTIMGRTTEDVQTGFIQILRAGVVANLGVYIIEGRTKFIIATRAPKTIGIFYSMKPKMC